MDRTATGCWWHLLVIGAVLLCAGAAAGQAPELRAMWASRFEWPDPNPATCRNTIDTIMSDLAAANFNAVFFQIRGQADVLYPSPYEVWSPLIGGSDPGWDPLAYAVESAHANGIEFHAYINTHTCWQAPGGAHVPPDNPAHLFYAHCNAADPNARDWLHHDVPDNPVQFNESNYVWIAPGVPAFQAYVRQQVMYVVENYDVDGVHFDRIRTPSSGQPSYDPISLARFNDPQSNPDGLDFTRWTADQITRNVCDIYAAIMAVRPEVQVSAAVFSNPGSAPTYQHQDAPAWAQSGAMDILVPMMYFTGGPGSTWDTRLQQWLDCSGGRHVVAGHITSQGLASLLEQIELTRLRGAQGNSVFSWSSFTYWSSYLANVYQDPASPPAMPWKTAPATGIICGRVTDAGGVPVVDAQVVRSGSTYTALSSGDGFYSLLLVPPGEYALTASHYGYDSVAVPGVSVSAGQVVELDIGLGALQPPVIVEVTPDPDEAVAGLEYTCQLQLSQGTAESWTLMQGPPDAAVDAQGCVRGWSPAVEEVGQLIQFTVRAENSAGHDDESWGVLVTAPPPCTPFKITDFEGYGNGERVLFNRPSFSGSTSDDLAAEPDVAEVTDAAAFSAGHSYLVRWQYIDDQPRRWMRLTTYNGAHLPNPTIELHRPIRVRLMADTGSFRLAVGIRETSTTADVGADGGTSGPIEWVGAESDIDGAPQGVLVEPMPGVWQTFIFDPLTDPVHSMTGDGVLQTSTNKGVFEHLAFTIVDEAGPFTVYIDDIDLLCGLPQFGDLDHDGDADGDDFDALCYCLAGPDVDGLPAGCGPECSADADGDVDLAEVAAFQEQFTGPVP